MVVNDMMSMIVLSYCICLTNVFVIETMSYHSLWAWYDVVILFTCLIIYDIWYCICVILGLVVTHLQVPNIDSTWPHRSERVFIPMASWSEVTWNPILHSRFNLITLVNLVSWCELLFSIKWSLELSYVEFLWSVLIIGWLIIK